jgi:endonuclease YncB( thermonuclease family)
MKPILIALLIVVLPAVCQGEDFNGYQLTNIRVIDGDTIEADILLPWSITLRQQGIRASDYDAWESSKRRRSVEVTDEEVRRGKIATEQLRGLAMRATIYALPDKEPRDNYGRILARLYYVDEEGRTESIAQMMTRGRHVRTQSID